MEMTLKQTCSLFIKIYLQFPLISDKTEVFDLPRNKIVKFLERIKKCDNLGVVIFITIIYFIYSLWRKCFLKYYKQNHLSSFYHAEFLSALNAKKKCRKFIYFYFFSEQRLCWKFYWKTLANLLETWIIHCIKYRKMKFAPMTFKT